MIRADGTKVEAVVKEKEEAKKEFQEAVKQGYTASLGSEETKDVFSISVGNISPSEVVTINLRYLQTLKDDEKRDQVRFTFPRTYAQRYGHAPTRNAQVASTAQQQFVLEAVIQQSGSIKSVSCPSGHPMDLELGKPSGLVVEESSSDSNFAKVTLRDASGFLAQDIILIITATGLDSPRCFTEAHPSPEHDTIAMGLTFVPRFKLPDVPNGMEYIFLVDRSGSMDGARIKLVREALVVLLRGLPTKGTTFNIFSFGNNVTKFWESSQAYSQSNLDAATKHVDSMAANYGGTEIAAALSSVYSSLPEPLARPVSLFLLTDGSAWNISNCVQHTRNTLSSLSTPENFIRVFTLGIGDGASTDTCDSIAMAGQGFSVYVAANEPVVGKCARLVRAARTPPFRDLEVFWTGKNVTSEGDNDFEIIEDDAVTLSDAKNPNDSKSPTSLSLFDDSGDAMDADEVGPPPKPKVTLPSPPRIQQAPLDIRNISPGTRSQMYAIISSKQTSIPSSIKVRGTVATTGTTVELEIPVTRMLRSQNHTILHTIAAKALITDRENDKHNFPQSISSSFVNNDELRSAYLEKDIVRLGTTYGLTSRYTSFVAVDRRTGESQPQSEKRGSPDSVGGPSGSPFARPGQMQRTASQGESGGNMDNIRMRSRRRSCRRRAVNAGPAPEPVAPLQVTESRWNHRGLGAAAVDWVVVDRQVGALLNNLTMEKFDSISDQIVLWANKSEKERDGRTLLIILRSIFEKATDNVTFSELYARLCRKMMDRISPKVQDDGIKDAEGKPLSGGQLFRKYLLNRCQKDFERGWVAKEATSAAAATESLEDQAKASEKKSEGDEVALYSDEYSAAQKARRQGLGLIKFMGELFKVQILPERSMHECVKKLLGNVENPEEEELESLCMLLTTVGQLLDTQKARAHMDVYFSRMKELTKSLNVSPRTQFMLQDVIELRECKWTARNIVPAPQTISQIREQAAKAEQAKEAYSRNLVTNRDASMTFGSSSIFNKKEAQCVSHSGTNSSANMFHSEASTLPSVGMSGPATVQQAQLAPNNLSLPRARASARLSGTASSASPPTMTEGERLAAVARLQHFDGGFSLTQGLIRLLKELTVDAFKQKCVDESQDVDVIATALALAWFEKNASDESLDLQEKASQWLADQLGDKDKVAIVKDKALKLFPL